MDNVRFGFRSAVGASLTVRLFNLALQLAPRSSIKMISRKQNTSVQNDYETCMDVLAETEVVQNNHS